MNLIYSVNRMGMNKGVFKKVNVSNVKVVHYWTALFGNNCCVNPCKAGIFEGSFFWEASWTIAKQSI